jgi:hypothetical protein
MQATNPSSRPGARVPWNITPAGSRLAHYLDYVDQQPGVASDIHFADIPPEQFDDDRPDDQGREGRLDTLYEKLDEQLRGLKLPDLSDEEFYAYRLRVKEIRRAIAEIEGE